MTTRRRGGRGQGRWHKQWTIHNEPVQSRWITRSKARLGYAKLATACKDICRVHCIIYIYPILLGLAFDIGYLVKRGWWMQKWRKRLKIFVVGTVQRTLLCLAFDLGYLVKRGWWMQKWRKRVKTFVVGTVQ